MNTSPARWPNDYRFHDLMRRVTEHYNEAAAVAEPSALHDALRELPTANVWRRAWLRDRVAVLSGGVR